MRHLILSFFLISFIGIFAEDNIYDKESLHSHCVRLSSGDEEPDQMVTLFLESSAILSKIPVDKVNDLIDNNPPLSCSQAITRIAIEWTVFLETIKDNAPSTKMDKDKLEKRIQDVRPVIEKELLRLGIDVRRSDKKYVSPPDPYNLSKSVEAKEKAKILATIKNWENVLKPGNEEKFIQDVLLDGSLYNKASKDNQVFALNRFKTKSQDLLDIFKSIPVADDLKIVRDPTSKITISYTDKGIAHSLIILSNDAGDFYKIGYFK